MNRKGYRKIAKKYGVSTQEVKRDMQEAINQAYVTPTNKALEVFKSGKIPTVDEFIDYAVNKVKEKQ